MRLKVADCHPVTLLKMNFFIGIFQGFWLQISEHLFSRTPLKWLLCRDIFRTIVNFKNQWWNQYRKKPLLYKNYKLKCLNIRWCFMSTKIIYAKWCYLTYCWYWNKNIQKIFCECSSLSTEVLSSVNNNSTIIYIYLMLQFKDENEASYFYVQGVR